MFNIMCIDLMKYLRYVFFSAFYFTQTNMSST